MRFNPAMRCFWCATWIVCLGSISSVLATLQVVEQPKNDTVSEGQSHILTCKFNEPVNCTWNRNGILITMTERYRFVSNNGTKTKDCSFEITAILDEFDGAMWQCVASDPNRWRSVSSDKAFLVIQKSLSPNQKEARIVEQPKNASVAHGQNHTLTCKFSDAVNCTWMRSKSAVKIGGRNRYINGNGTNATDCSFLIANFTYTDATSWQCSALHGPGRIYTEAAVSNVAFLSTKSDPSAPLEIVVQPVNDTVHPEQNHTLYCKFSASVNCFWDRSGTEITIDDRYRYINNNGIETPDCSFHISNFSEEFDAKIWQCKALDPNKNRMIVSEKIFLAISRDMHHSRTTLGFNEAAFNIVEQPKNATVTAGQTTNLTCKFSKPVNCAWTPTDSNSRYHYVSSNGKATKDCSLQITNFTYSDATSWQCTGTSTASNTKQVVSNKVVLTIQNKLQQQLQKAPMAAATIPISVQPQNASLFIGQDHLLSCIFSTPVNCSWHINGIPVVIDEGRYKYGTGGGQNTVNCSFLLTNVYEQDFGYWECYGKLPSDGSQYGSDKAFLSQQVVVWPNRTAILLNGNPVTEIWVPKNGSQNGTLQCVAEYAVPAVQLYWNHIGKDDPQGNPGVEEVCSESCHCNSTLTWIGDWKQLLNSSTLSCYIVQLNISALVTTMVMFKNEPAVSGSALSAGAVAGIVIVVLLVVILIIGILVYFLVMKPRKKKNMPTNITMTLSSNNNDGGDVAKKPHPSPALSEKSNANSTPGRSAETVQMNDRQPQVAPQSPVKVPLVKNVGGESKPNDNAGDSSEDSDVESADQKPELSTRYSKPFAYIVGNTDVFPVKKVGGK